MKKTGKAGYLFKNVAVFTVGSFVSKLLVFFLVPFYTSVLTESEYGIADVMQSSLLLLVPFLSVNAGEAALRYGLENTGDRDLILSEGLKKVLFSIIPVALGSILLSFLIPAEGPYFLLFTVLYAADSFYEYLLLYCQGLEEVQKMMSGSIACTALVIAANLLFLLYFRLGIYGYLLAEITAFTGAALLMFCLVDGAGRLKRASANEALSLEMTGYGRSMLLYSTASWVNNAIDRYFILFMLGSGQNGLYGVAYKIPAILTTLQRIFAMAWQMSAVQEYKGDDRESFFSEMYGAYQTVLITGCSLIILFLKLIADLMFKKSFYNAWPLVPPLLISVVFGALEGFLGSIALAFKDGKSMGRATGIGAVFNIVLNYILILRFGAFGAAAATLVSYFIMFFLAFIFVRRHVRIRVNVIRDVAAYALLILESAAVILNVKNYLLINCGIVAILFILYHREGLRVVKGTWEIALERLKNR
ncbi:MAG: polysaccharide biosynthesis C-terminal domain-containing protein [Lachnospiraceae bacterium]|nr:polysaccharide biosynthesis C-terminal domain-containing protein [Lachnospiraceae bacterium]